MDTVIEFIGLCVFTTQILNPSATARLANQAVPFAQYTVVAIMPSVPGTTSPNHATSTALQAKNTVQVPTQGPMSQSMASRTGHFPAAPMTTAQELSSVETHTAMIAFRQSDLICVDGWLVKNLKLPGNAASTPCGVINPRTNSNGTNVARSQLQAIPTWVYIKLSGEHLHFVADSTNTHVNATNQLALPHLGSYAGGTLTAPYTPGSNYSGAAAVFTISNGVLRTCEKPSSNGNPGRIDTTLTLHTAVTNQLIITNDSGGKRLILAAGALVIAGNAPLVYAQGQTDTNMTGPHYLVYCAMIGQTNCSWPPPEPATPPAPTLPSVSCSTALAYLPPPPPPPSSGSQQQIVRVSGPAELVEIADFTCSNSQWP